MKEYYQPYVEKIVTITMRWMLTVTPYNYLPVSIISSCQPPLDDNSLQIVSSDSLPQLPVDDNFIQTPVDNSHVHILPQTPDDESFGDYSFSFQKKDIKSNVHPWKNLPEELLPCQSQYTYVIDTFQTFPREDFSGAPKFAFKFQARINISSSEVAFRYVLAL